MTERPALFAMLLAAAACSEGKTTGSVCTSGDVRCAENVYEVCADDGESYGVIEDCSPSDLVCVFGEGCLECSPGARYCDGFDIVRCREDGSGADTVGSCDAEQGDVCFAGACENACELAKQNRSYQGCEYWAADLDNAVVSDLGTAAAQQFTIVLSNSSQLTADVTVDIWCTDADAANPAIQCTSGQPHTLESFSIEPDGQKIVDLDPRELDGTSSPELNDGPGTFVSAHAFRVQSTAPLVAYQFNPLDNVDVFSNDASLLLPTSALGSRYLALSWPQTIAVSEVAEENFGIDLRTFLTVVATQDDTIVRVKLSTDIVAGGPFPAAVAGEMLEFTLDAFEVANFETGGFNADFTGTAVESPDDKPVAVFAGGEASDVPFFDTIALRLCCADHLEEQLFPETAFGTQFVAVKTPLRTFYVDQAGWDVAVVPDEPEYWRILATHEDTSISTDLPPPNNAFFLQRGDFVTFESERDFIVQASDPIAFGQFPASQQTTGIPSTIAGERAPGGDPAYITIPPVQQWRDDYLFLVPNRYAFDFLLIAAPSSAVIEYDGSPLADALPRCEYEPIGTLPNGANEVEYSAIRCPLSAPMPGDEGLQDDGPHRITSVNGDPIGLVVYGWDSFVSYGYPGGTNVDLINID
jgi:hypothetical protein